jgi:hypothetical protein
MNIRIVGNLVTRSTILDCRQMFSGGLVYTTVTEHAGRKLSVHYSLTLLTTTLLVLGVELILLLQYL